MATLKAFFTTLVYQPLFNLLFWFVAVLPGESLGLGIIALTIVVRILLLPASAAAVKSQREMAALQPKIDEIRSKHAAKPEEMNQKLLAVYQEHKVNPFGSCLPLLIQLPILWVLYQVFWGGIHATNFDLLYHFVPRPEALQTTLVGIDLAKPSLVLAVIAGALQFLQTWQLLKRTQQTKDRTKLPASEKKATPEASKLAQSTSNQTMYLMPLFTVFISATLPSALAVYWAVTTAFSILQQWYLIRTQPALPHHHVAVTVRKKRT